MGFISKNNLEDLRIPDYLTFDLRFTKNKDCISKPETFRFRENILQSAIRAQLMSDIKLQALLGQLELTDMKASDFEILGEKALTQGHIDLLLKQRIPLGSSLKIPMEVKTNKAQAEDLTQLSGYMDELQGECPGGVLIASDFSKHIATKANELGVRLIRYSISADLNASLSFDEIQAALNLTRV